MSITIMNQYARVTALTMMSATLSATDRHGAAGQGSALTLAAGDPILVVVVGGAAIHVPTDPTDPSFGDPAGMPPWDIMRTSVASFDPATNLVTFEGPIPELLLGPDVEVQLVKIWRISGDFVLMSNVVAPPWRAQPGSQTLAYGGVVAIEVTGDLTLQASIGTSEGRNDVGVFAGGGHRGGRAGPLTTAPEQTLYRYATSDGVSSFAGGKGEGLAKLAPGWGAGRGKAFDGGGGGNVARSGGGGGAGGGAGGKGGKSVDNSHDIGGLGGVAPVLQGLRRFGGGGGAGGSGDSGITRGGGAGGGLVYLVVEGTLTVGAGQVISAAGADGGEAASGGGAGGGGGGGTIDLRAGRLAGTGRLDARGGRGGQADRWGGGSSPGGGGGGGIIRVECPVGTLNTVVTGGPPGPTTLPELAAEAGQDGVVLWSSAPQAHDARLHVVEDTALQFALRASGAGPLTYEILESPVHGVLTGDAPALTYKPTFEYHGADRLTFRVWDGSVCSNLGTVTFVVQAVNDPPIPQLARVRVIDIVPRAFALSALDLEGDALTFEVVIDPLHGVLSGDPPNLTYTAEVGYSGTDSLVFTVSDGQHTAGPTQLLFDVVAYRLRMDAVHGFPGCSGEAIATFTNLSGIPAPLTELGVTDAQGVPVPWFTRVSPLPLAVPAGGQAQVAFAYTVPAESPGSQQLLCAASFEGLRMSAPFPFVDASVPPGLRVSVRDRVSQQPIAGASLSVDNSGDTWLTDAAGEALLAVAPGRRTVFAYAAGHLPGEVTLDYSSDDPDAALTLQPGDVITVTGASVTPIDPIPGDPDGYWNVEFMLAIQGAPITVVGAAPPTLPPGGVHQVPLPGGGGTLIIAAPPVGGEPWPIEVCPQVWVVIPGGIRVRKQYFSAAVVLINATDYALTGVQVSLAAPDGIGLPPVGGAAQATTLGPWDVSPHGGACRAEWVVRGDRPGVYTLTGSTSGTLTLGGVGYPIGGAWSSPAFTVARPQFDLLVTTPSAVLVDEPFDIGLEVVNTSTEAPLVDVSITLPAAALTGCALAPGEVAEHPLGDIPPGGSAGTVYHFVSQVTGTVVAVQRWLAGDGASILPIVDEAPAASPLAVDVHVRGAVDIDVLAHVLDPEGQPVTLASVTPPSRGAALVNADGTIRYTPTGDQLGVDHFTYRARDVAGNLSNPATVAVTILNAPPVAHDQVVATPEDTPVTVTLAATDPEQAALTYAVVTLPAHGVLEGAAPNLTYRPHANYSGLDVLTFTASDGARVSNAGTVTLKVAEAYDPPTADPQSVTAKQAALTTITLTGGSPDGRPLHFEVIAPPAHGALKGTPPVLGYTSAKRYLGNDAFTFRVTDDAGGSATATVDIRVVSRIIGIEPIEP